VRSIRRRNRRRRGMSPQNRTATPSRRRIPLRVSGVYGRRELHTPISARHAPIVRAAVEGTLHGWQRLARFQAAIVYPSMKTRRPRWVYT